MRRDWNSDFQFEIVSHTSPGALIASRNHCHHLSRALCLPVAAALSPDTPVPLGGPAAGTRMHAPSSVAPDSPPPFDSLSACLFASRPGRRRTAPFSQPEFRPSVSLSTLNAALLWSLYTSCLAHSSYTCSFSKPPTFPSLSSHTSSSLSHPPSPVSASFFSSVTPSV